MSVELNGKTFYVKNKKKSGLTLNLSRQKINDITEIKGLDKLSDLERLNLSFNDISEIKGLDNLINLKHLLLGHNKLTSLKGLEKLVNIEFLYLGNKSLTTLEGLGTLRKLRTLFFPQYGPLYKWLRKGNAGGVKMDGRSKDPQAAVAYCRQKKEEDKCILCNKNHEGKFNICPDCDRKVCKDCWDAEMAICNACKKKLQMLKSGTPTTPTLSAPTSSVSTETDPFEPSRLIKLRNAFQMSSRAPIKVLSRSFGYPDDESFISWIFELGVPGIKIDYESNMLIVDDNSVIETLNSFIDSTME